MVIETQRVTGENLPTFLTTLEGCWKSSSFLWLHSNAFPVLSGLIVKEWVQETTEAVSRFSLQRSLTELLVRIEKPGQRWTSRRGGYTIPIQNVHGLVDELAREGMLTILLEPASPYTDLYCMSSVCDLSPGKVDIEVVGPGFDASDILRSDTTPHERFEVSLDLGAIRPGEAATPQIRRAHLVEPDAYRASVQRRLTKIGARLRNPSFPDKVLKAATNRVTKQLAQEAIQDLQKTGHTLLLEHLNDYEPIPREMLEVFLKQLLRLYEAIVSSRLPWQVLSAPASFLEPGRLVMWDFFPAGNHDTRLLSNIRATPMSG